MNTTVEIIERATPALQRMALELDGRAVRQAIGEGVVILIQEHFYGLPPNKADFPTTRFWPRAAEATSCEEVSNGVQVSVSQTGVRQRFLGGGINPVRGKFLTIPAIAEAYGHGASDFADLKVYRTSRDGSPALALARPNLVPDQTGGINPDSVYYWLVRHVSQEPDPSVLPEDKEIFEAALKAARDFFARSESTGGNRR